MAVRRSTRVQAGVPQREEDHARRRLLRAARELLSEHGPQGATARAICDKAGVRAPTLYYHFGDLFRLHQAAVNASFLEIMAGYRRHSRVLGAVAAVRQAWEALMYFATAEPLMARLLIEAVVENRPPAALALTLTRLRSDMDDLAARGGLAVSGEVATGMLWTAAVGAVCLATNAKADPVQCAQVSDALLETILAGVIVPVAD